MRPATHNIGTELPYWPALMDVETACAYVAMSEPTFRAVFAKVAPVDLGGPRLTRWRKSDLDRAIAAFPVRVDRNHDSPGSSGSPPTEAPETIDLAAAALERSARRARR